MNWLALILGIVKALGSLVGYLNDRRLFSAGQAEQIASELKAQSDALQKALAAREAVRGDLVSNTDRVREPDEFSRD